ncbi:MAG: hypothetical protein IRY95_08060 [Clostridia bacterium]|nr:hypothetical protein [Clostridia bacterium]
MIAVDWRPLSASVRPVAGVLLAGVIAISGCTVARRPGPDVGPNARDAAPRDLVPRDGLPRDGLPRDTGVAPNAGPNTGTAPRTAAGAARVPDRLLTWDRLQALNPDLRGAQRVTGWVDGMGYHYGRAGEYNLLVLLDDARRVLGVESIFPASTGWKPWFDQARDRPEPGLGYSQHIYFVDPRVIKPGMRSETMLSGLRGFDELKKVNYALYGYRRANGFQAGLGERWAPPNHEPGIRVLVGRDGGVVGLELPVPSERGWQPWFSEPRGRPVRLEGEEVYTQHIFFVDRRAIR